MPGSATPQSASVLDAFEPVKQVAGIELRRPKAPLFGTTRPPRFGWVLIGFAAACLAHSSEALQPTWLRGIPGDVW